MKSKKTIECRKLGEFQAKRLTQARLAKKWRRSDLAEKVGLTRQAISSYENQDSNPSPEKLRELAQCLEVSEAFFMTPPYNSENRLESAINFRTLKASSEKARNQACTYMEWIVDTFDFASMYVELPKVDIPVFEIHDFIKLDDEAIEDYANATRKHFGLGDGPISNITWLLESKGVIVSYLPLESGIDGVSAWYKDRPVILINSNAYYARARFDLAHELGHLVLHRMLEQEDLQQKEILAIVEKQANRFAGAFIAPFKTLLQEIYGLDLRSFVDLKKRWGISVQALIMRLFDLSILSEHQKARFFMRISVEGWRRKEPLDDVIKAERPTLLKKIANLLDEAKILLLNEFSIRSKLPTWLVDEIACLPKFKNAEASFNNIFILKPK